MAVKWNSVLGQWVHVQEDEGQREKVLAYIRNEPVFYVKLSKASGMTPRESFAEGVDEADVRSAFDYLQGGARVMEVRRANEDDVDLMIEQLDEEL